MIVSLFGEWIFCAIVMPDDMHALKGRQTDKHHGASRASHRRPSLPDFREAQIQGGDDGNPLFHPTVGSGFATFNTSQARQPRLDQKPGKTGVRVIHACIRTG